MTIKGYKFIFVLFCSFAAIVFADAPEYVIVTMDGQKCGYGVSQRLVEDGLVVTTQEVKMKLSRLGFTIEVLEKSSYTETKEGLPVSFIAEQKYSGAPAQIIEGKVVGGKLYINRTGEKQEVVDYDDNALMPEGQRLFILKKGIKPGVKFELTVFDATLAKGLLASAEIFGIEKVDLLGRVKELYKMVTSTNVPGAGEIKETSYIDSDVKAYKISSSLMGMTIEMIDCEKEVAMSEAAPVDMFSNFLLVSPVSIPKSSLDGTITYTLKTKPEAKDTVIPSGDNQTVETEGNKSVVRVSPVKGVKGDKISSDYDEAIEVYLAHNGYIQSEEPEIKALAKKAVGTARDTLTAAHKIELFVNYYINEKNLSVGYSTSLEVARSREGDCTEHAVLTTALCRAAGIPARVVFGVVYAEQFAGGGDIFGGHAWTECYVGGKWIGLDATIGKNGYGSGHIKLADGEGRPEDFFSLVNILGNFEVAEVDIEE